MSSTTTRVPPTDITGVQGFLLKTMARRMLGQVPDSIGVMWHHPTVLKDLMRLGRRTEKWDRVDDALATYAVMAAAGAVGCSFCLDYNYFMAHHRGLHAAKVREVPRWRDSQLFTPLERQAMEYAEAMSQTPPAVGDELSAQLLAQLGAPALLELTARIGVMNLTARSNIALGIRSQEFAEACGLQPLAPRPSDVASPA